ncbi:MAG: hypothetical protein ABI366_01740 [Ginsengibacter sp.]
MKRFFTLLLLMFVSCSLFAQESYAQNYSSQKYSPQHKSHINKNVNFNGQWKGSFHYTVPPGYYSFGENTNEYVLELTTEGSEVSGYSYTYYQEGLKKYYTICRITGTLNRHTNTLEIKEIERIKSNTPPGITNCFQIHKLHYEKDSDNMEVLRGTWIPAPNQTCTDTGTTVLSRRVVNPMPIGYMPRTTKPATKPLAKAPVKKPVHKNPVAAAPAKPKYPAIKKAPQPKKPTIETPDRVQSLAQKDFSDGPIQKPSVISPNMEGFKSRRKDIVKTITITEPTFRLDFYDNGEVDGDSITVFYNGKMVLSHQRLSEKPISITLSVDKNAPENIVTMYADNLGSIPPNTALMVVTDGSKRYEVRIESDTEKSGSVIFKSAK